MVLFQVYSYIYMTSFQTFITNWYTTYGRGHLPWRQTFHPYTVLVSELMLQQTQVERVIPKYGAFLERFPSVELLATAQQKEVITLWQGLGYNRRAIFLHKCAHAVCALHGGQFPTSSTDLQQLPGIGPYTASAIMAFAYNQPVVLIETNVRAVFLHHFFPEKENVSDAELSTIVSQELLTENPRLWYSALMDYGSFLKRAVPNPSRKSKHHTRQSKFAGSLRQVRGEIIRLLTVETYLTEKKLLTKMTSEKSFLEPALEQLVKEQMIHSTKKGYTLS